MDIDKKIKIIKTDNNKNIVNHSFVVSGIK